MRGVRIGVVIIDNGISWCTGGQKPAGAIESAIKDYPSKTADLRKGGITGLHEALQEMKSADGLFVLRVVVPDLALRTRSLMPQECGLITTKE